MNPLTLACFHDALEHDPRLPKRAFDDIQARVSEAWHTHIAEMAQPFWMRAVWLWHVFRPECVSEDGVLNGYVDCDICHDNIGSAMTHFVYSWWLYQHPAWQLDRFSEAEAHQALEAIRIVDVAETMQHQDYQMALFTEVT